MHMYLSSLSKLIKMTEENEKDKCMATLENKEEYHW